MIVKSYSTVTKKITREQIWNLATDINRWNEWDPSVDESHLDGSFEAGKTFMLKPKGAGKVTIYIEEAIKNKYFRDLTKFPLAKMYGEHTYEDTPEGVKITITMTIKGVLAKLWYKIVMKGIVDYLEEDIKNQIEAAKKR